MSSTYHNILSGFRAVNAWQQTIIKNAQGLLQPGYNQERIAFGSTGAQASGTPAAPTTGSGSRSAGGAGGDTLSVASRSLKFEQGDLQLGSGPTSLAIEGPGFFLVAENLRPDARVFLTRNGDFKYDAQGRLVTSQGLFVVGGSGALTNPPTPVTNPGDGTVDLTKLTLGRVPVASALQPSGYGALVYEVSASSGPMRAFKNGDAEVGLVRSDALEYPSRLSLQAELTVETTYAQQTYKLFKDMLDSYNKMVDDAIGTVR